MSSDRSRTSDRPRRLNAGIVAQQGRVMLDRDINALQEITLGRLNADALDFVGPCGTPDNGFQISLPGAAPTGPFWTPPETSPPTPPQALGTGRDFLIGPGTMYVGGWRVEFPSRQAGTAIAYSYLDQPSWAVPDAIRTDAPQELVYLDVSLQEVGAVEDPDLLEVALGGPDTTQRLRLLPFVRRRKVTVSDCLTAWQQAVGDWTAEGLTFAQADMSLKPAVKLQVAIVEPAGGGDPCDPVASGGYLGADNQLIRVQISNDGDQPWLVWGYDNASFLYRISAVAEDRKTLTLASAPPDAFHTPASGQVVEILRTTSVVASEPDVSDTGGAPILRVAAEARGSFRTLAKPYGPTSQGDPTSYIVLDTALDAEVAMSTLPLFLRVWQARAEASLNTAIPLEDTNTGKTTGLAVTVSDSQVLTDGAYWQIAARPSTPQGVYPEDLLVGPQTADGPIRHVCPLAVIDWSAQPPGLTDCRSVFDNLVTLTKRKPGCCTVAIAPTDITGTVTLQGLIDDAVAAAAAANNMVTVCLAAGPYMLPAPLRLDWRHRFLTLESCGGFAELTTDTSAAAAFFDGLIVLEGAADVTLRGLALEPALTLMPREFLDRIAGGEGAEDLFLLRTPSLSLGVRAVDATNLTLHRCLVEFVEQRADTKADLVAAAVFLQGDCSGFTARDCGFGSAIAPTCTPLATAFRGRGEDVRDAKETAAAPAAAAPAAPITDANLEKALDNLYASRASETVLQLQRAVTATAGVVAVGYAPAAASNDATKAASAVAIRLGQADLHDNSFERLTFGAFILAEFDVLRLRDNTVSKGVAGFWTGLPSTQFPDARSERGLELQGYPAVILFEEGLLLAGVAAALAPPTAASGVQEETRQAAQPGAFVEDAGPVNAALFVTGNSISTGQHPPPLARPVNEAPATGLTGSCALLLWMDDLTTEAQAANSDISTLVTGNHLISASLTAPTAMVLLANAQACTITGNIILNQPSLVGVKAPNNATPAYQVPPSLWVVTDFDNPQQPVAVAGNVLRGGSNLGFYARTGAAARLGWSPLNADPN